ncbi:MAG TPA: arabinofuranosidase catalytic domain-containing protein [Bryobacteraceae bacterium]|jgi:hypothetical protein|nr:arabinofuranosidase catalytic domain-containing protein [Bryobacteraceae bacterium]
MRRLLSLLILAAALVCSAAAQIVNINVPVLDGKGYPVTTGYAYFTWSQFFSNSDVLVQAGQKTVAITGGMLSVSLTASDKAGYVYNVLITGGNVVSSSQWKVPAFGGITSITQLTQAGEVSSVTGTVGSRVTISNLSLSPDDTTIVGTWYTNTSSDTHLNCGGKVAVDDGVQINATFHQAVVTGLNPATPYGCMATSGLTSSPATNVTTLPAPTRSAITSVSISSATKINSTYNGDTLYNCVSNDGYVYNTMDDGYGWVGGSGTGANMQIDKVTNQSTFAGVTVNIFANYGGFYTKNGTDGPNGTALSNKLSGLFCMAGKLFAYHNRAQYATTYLIQPEFSGDVIMSADHGATWNSWQDPTANNPNGNPPNPLGSYQFASPAYAWGVPVRYAADDGTLGYLTKGNRQDGGNAFVYTVWTDGYWNNGSNLYLTRVPRAIFAQLNPGTTQYWIGPTSPTESDFVNDSNWSYSAANATAIYSSPYQVSSPDEVYVPSLNTYLLLEWYNPGGATPAKTNSSNSVWVILSGTTPAGPWTQVATQTNNPSGYYNPVVFHPSLGAITSASGTTNLPLEVLFSGDYGAGSATYYFPTSATITLNPTASTLPLDSVTGIPALFAGSVARALSLNYVGPLVNIQRASDNTTIDIGQTGGLLNRNAVTTFCAGTSCNVKILYDQSGGGHNATQSTFANMPILYNNGAIIVKNGEPTMQWDNTSRWLACPQTINGTAFETAGVATLNSSGAPSYAGLVILSNGSAGGGSSAATVNLLDRPASTATLMTSYNNGANPPVSAITYGTAFTFDTGVNIGGAIYQKVGGTVNGGTAASGTVASTSILIGSDYPQSTYYWYGNIAEVLVYGGALNSTQRSSVYNSLSSFYSAL